MNREFPELTLHNMLVSDDMPNEYHALFEEASFGKNISVYLYISSKTSPNDAPKGCENWFVMIHAPHIENQDWEALVESTRVKAIEKINRMLKTNIEKHIVNEERITPLTIRDEYRSAFGSVYGNSSNNKFSTFLRHPNFTSKIKHLYFVGGTVHPGAGLPMCLNSSKIVDGLFE